MQSSSLGAPAAGRAEERWGANAARQAGLGREIWDLDFTPLGFFVGFLKILFLAPFLNFVKDQIHWGAF